MNQSRYFYAFILSGLSFILLYFIAISLPKIEKKTKPKPSKAIQIAIINPVKKVVPKTVEKPKTIKNLKPKVKTLPKPIVKKKIIKKKKIVKKIVKKKVKPKKRVIKKHIPKKVIHREVVPRQIVKEAPVKRYVPPVPVAPPVYHTPTPKAVIKPIIKASPKPPMPQVRNSQHKKAFLRNVRSQIMANKKYPKLAKRRHIEGSVKVRFDINRNGEVGNIRFISGKRIFQKSIRKTLENTFPMSVPANVQADLPILNVSVILHFNLR